MGQAVERMSAGPWHRGVIGQDEFRRLVVFDTHGGQVATVLMERDVAPITAVPLLLDALQALLVETVDRDLAEGVELSDGARAARERALEAIAAACGEEG